MIVEYESDELQELCEAGRTNNSRYKKYAKDKIFIRNIARKLQLISPAQSFEELKTISPLHYEQLKYDYSNFSSFRIMNGKVERMICKEEKDKLILRLIDIDIDNTHYGNKE